MSQGRATVSAKLAAASLFAVSSLQSSAPVGAAPVTTEKAACDRTKASVAARDHFPESAIAFCDVIIPEAQPKGFYVLGLHGVRNDCADICGSTLMGWFAVQRSSGEVFEWDINEGKPGALVKARP